MKMTKSVLLDICKEHNLYRTPHINDKLYLNFKGFTHIANLEQYTGLKALFIEGNALESFEGMPELPYLKCLYAHQNRLKSLEGLAQLKALHSLNISNNEITSLEGLQACPDLETLICTHNFLETAASIQSLLELPNLQTIDLQSNKLDDPDIMAIFTQMPNLKCLYLKGNPVVSRIKNYRKSTIVGIPSLTYLDDRPVFDNERKIAESWGRDGLDGERAARDTIRAEEKARERRNFEYLQAIRAEGFRQRRERRGLPPGDTDPDLEALSDEEWTCAEDPPELVAARERLARYEAERASGNDPAKALECAAQDQVEVGEDGANIRDGPSSLMSDGEIYLNQLKASQDENGVSAGVRGLDFSRPATVPQPSAELRSKCFTLAASLQGETPNVDSPPPLERVPPAATGGSLHDLD